MVKCITCTPEKRKTYFENFKQYLIPFEDEKYIPESSFIIYNMDGGKYYILRTNYSSFLTLYLRYHLTNETVCSHLVFDLNHAEVHTIYFDIDYKLDEEQLDHYYTTAFIEETLIPKIKIVFQNFETFSILITGKSIEGGLHVYLPEFKISNEDYEILINSFKKDIDLFEPNARIQFVLDDKVKNYSLPFATKPNKKRYNPLQFILVFESELYKIDLQPHRIDDSIQLVNKNISKIRKKKLIKNTAFYVFMKLPSSNRFFMLQTMISPNNNNFLYKIYHVGYPTVISEDDHDMLLSIANFEFTTLEQRKVLKQVFKNISEPLNISKHPNMVYKYIKMHITRINSCSSNISGNAIPRWFEKLKRRLVPTRQDIFHSINIRLKQDNDILVNAVHPIKSILTFNNGCFLSPMFYALHNCLEIDSKQLCEELSSLLHDHTDILTWIYKFSRFDSNVIKVASKDYTYNTILYCGGNLHPPVTELKLKLDKIMNNMGFAIDRNMTLIQITDLTMRIINLYFTMKKTSKDKKIFWNPVKGKWININNQDEFKSILGTVADTILAYYEKIFKIPCPHKNFHIKERCNNLLTMNNLIENDYVDLDHRKWTLRTNEGALDLLTGHISIVVPEQFLSCRTIMSNWSNLSTFIYSPILKSLYKKIWTEEFLNLYVKMLKEEEIYDYISAQKELTSSEGQKEEIAMFHAYAHICKFLRFNFLEMEYFLYAISSNLIATNYGKFIFIMQGLKNNGKSRVFKLFEKILSGYSATIDTDAFLLKRKSETKPEIASNAFGCRVIICEELSGEIHENFLKILSGNSVVSARNLYESHKSGIPTIKIWFSTNKPPSIITTTAFQERILPFNFAAKFTNNPPEDICHQVIKGEFAINLDEEILNETALGMFLFMYFTIEEYISLKDGFLHYPTIPQSIEKFKNSYLEITDIYKLFKSLMDIQHVKGEIITIQQLTSAIRHFLKITKNTTKYSEQEIMNNFDEEFQDRKFYSSENIYSSDSSSDNDDDDDKSMFDGLNKKRNFSDSFEESFKKRKCSNESEELITELENDKLRNHQSCKNSYSELQYTKQSKTEKETYLCYRDLSIKNIKK